MSPKIIIGQLPPAQVPLAGTEQIPLDQNGVTARVSASQFAASPGGINSQVQFNDNGSFGGLTAAELTALIDTFTDTLSGAVPAPGAINGHFLRDDGTWAAAGGGPSIFSVTGQFVAGHAQLSGASDPRITSADFSENGTGSYTFFPLWLPNGIQWFVFMPSTNSEFNCIVDTGFGGAGSGLAELYMKQFTGGAFTPVDAPWYLIFSG